MSVNNVSAGKDRSVGMVMAILTELFSSKVNSKNGTAGPVSKESIQNVLLFIQTHRHVVNYLYTLQFLFRGIHLPNSYATMYKKASPSRATLKKVNTYFLSPNQDRAATNPHES